MYAAAQPLSAIRLRDELRASGSDLELEPVEHGTHGSVFRARDVNTGLCYIIKRFDDEELLRKELDGLKELSRYFNVPEVKIINSRLLRMEDVGTLTLHDCVVRDVRPTGEILTVFRDFLGRLRAMWKGTARNDDHGAPTAMDFCQELLSDFRQSAPQFVDLYWDNQLKIKRLDQGNVGFYPSMNRTYEIAATLKNLRPPVLVRSHGDEHPQNLVLQRQNAWKIIDFDRVGWHDWVYILSKLLAYWPFYGGHCHRQEVKHDTESWRTELAYSLDVPPIVAQLDQMVVEEAACVAADFDDRSWLDRMAYYQLGLFLRRVMFNVAAKYKMVSANMLVAMLGEAIVQFYNWLFGVATARCTAR